MSAMQVRNRAAERFAAALDGGAAVVELPASLAELVGIVERVASVPQPVMAADASARIRQRLVAVAAVQAAGNEANEPSAARALSWRARRVATVAVGALTGVTAVAGVAVGAAHSLPGDPLYSLKRAAEGLQLDLAGSPAAKADRELQFAQTRMAELRAIGVRDGHAAALLGDLRSELSSARTDVVTAVTTDHDQTPLANFEATTRKQVAALFGLAQNAPAALLPQLRATVVRIVQLDRSVQHLAAKLPVVPVVPGHPLPGHPASPAPAVSRSARPHRSATATNQPSVHRSTGPSTGATRSGSTGRLSTAPSTSSSGTLGKVGSALPSPVKSLTSAVPSDLKKLLSGLPLTSPSNLTSK